jgi:carbohydrate kinase (thermoresistant glucokinase family)
VDPAAGHAAAVNHPRVLVIMGVSGVGKTTVAERLARRLGWDFAEGDAMHPAANVAKMTAGNPLTDADRAPWLAQVAAWIDERLDTGRPGVISCSALRRVYRDELRRPGVLFVFLDADRVHIAAQLGNRHGHFMPAGLLDSQLAALEPPTADEPAVRVEVSGHSPDEIVAAVLADLGLG